MSLTLQIIICSTRPSRIGPLVAHWFHDFAIAHGKFLLQLIDLAEVALPLYDEPKHPALQDYQHEHTQRWSEIVKAADAYVFVTPEYNYGPPPALLNALTYVYKEWNYKPAGFVSYGGVSGGMRAVQTERLMMVNMKMAPLVEAVIIPMVARHIDDQRRFQPNQLQLDSAKALLDELHRWAGAMKPLRS